MAEFTDTDKKKLDDLGAALATVQGKLENLEKKPVTPDSTAEVSALKAEVAKITDSIGKLKPAETTTAPAPSDFVETLTSLFLGPFR